MPSASGLGHLLGRRWCIRGGSCLHPGSKPTGTQLLFHDVSQKVSQICTLALGQHGKLGGKVLGGLLPLFMGGTVHGRSQDLGCESLENNLVTIKTSLEECNNVFVRAGLVGYFSNPYLEIGWSHGFDQIVLPLEVGKVNFLVQKARE